MDAPTNANLIVNFTSKLATVVVVSTVGITLPVLTVKNAKIIIT